MPLRTFATRVRAITRRATAATHRLATAATHRATAATRRLAAGARRRPTIALLAAVLIAVATAGGVATAITASADQDPTATPLSAAELANRQAARADRAQRQAGTASTASPTNTASPASPTNTASPTDASSASTDASATSATPTKTPTKASTNKATKKATAKAPAWVLPETGVELSSCYGMRWGALHQGIDFAGDDGTTIHAVGAGTVVAAGWNYDGYGISVVIDHHNGYLTHYAHAQKALVKPGQQVKTGQAIAIEGSTGDSTGPHLHFEVHQGSLWNQIDPAPWLRARGLSIGC